jgi:hypothetical protein
MTLDISGGGIASFATSTEEQAASAAHPNTNTTKRIEELSGRPAVTGQTARLAN